MTPQTKFWNFGSVSLSNHGFLRSFPICCCVGPSFQTGVLPFWVSENCVCFGKCFKHQIRCILKEYLGETVETCWGLSRSARTFRIDNYWFWTLLVVYQDWWENGKHDTNVVARLSQTMSRTTWFVYLSVMKHGNGKLEFPVDGALDKSCPNVHPCVIHVSSMCHPCVIHVSSMCHPCPSGPPCLGRTSLRKLSLPQHRRKTACQAHDFVICCG